MIKLIFVNILLFAGCIALFVLVSIGYSMGNTGKHEGNTSIAYIFVAAVHLFINNRLLDKWQLASRRNRIVSTVSIIAAYIIYLFIF